MLNLSELKGKEVRFGERNPSSLMQELSDCEHIERKRQRELRAVFSQMPMTRYEEEAAVFVLTASMLDLSEETLLSEFIALALKQGFLKLPADLFPAMCLSTPSYGEILHAVMEPLHDLEGYAVIFTIGEEGAFDVCRIPPDFKCGGRKFVFTRQESD